MTYMLLMNCALKLVEEIILYYDARSKKHQITQLDITVHEELHNLWSSPYVRFTMKFRIVRR